MGRSCLIDTYSIMHSTMLVFGLLMTILKNTGAEVGVCYGMEAEHLPPKADVIALFQQKNIQRTRLYAPDGDALGALGGTNIKVMLDVPNDKLEEIAASEGNVKWVDDNIKQYNNVNFQYIAVGNEVKPSDPSAKFLLPAMQKIHKAILDAGLADRIKVSTATFMGAIDKSSPPSEAIIHPDYQEILVPVINFLRENQAPLLVNIYPYIAYHDHPEQIPLEYALFTADQSKVVHDGQLEYQNLFYAMLDAVYSAVEKVGGGSLDIVVSESGWPTDGGVGANFENAMKYNTNLVQRVNQGQGTPKRNGKPIEVYLFAMFDENRKEVPPEYERHWGLFTPDLKEKYSLSFN